MGLPVRCESHSGRSPGPIIRGGARARKTRPLCRGVRLFRPTARLPRIPAAMAKERKERSDVLDRLVYVALRLVAAALHCFPVDTNLRTAKLIGSLMYRFAPRHRERAMGNLRRSFPDMPERRRARMAERSMQHLVMLAVEVLFTTRLIRLDTYSRYVTLSNFRDVLDLMIRRERGLIMLTGHYGNWEVLGYVLATLGFPTTSIARPLDNPYVSD